MGYLHIENLYKNQTILLLKECYALEKIHGTSAHIIWRFENKQINFFAGGESHEKFIKLFNIAFLREKFTEIFPDINVVVFGEAYGGKQQSMSNTYGKELKFIGFDVKVGDVWLNVLNAEDVCTKLNIEFVSYKRIEAILDNLTIERDSNSVQAIRNGITEPKKREGIVLRPLVEMSLSNGDRLICKYKSDEFGEVKTPRDIDSNKLKILEGAKNIAEEWVTNIRLEHILQKFTEKPDMKDIPTIINNMIEDVYREGKNEIVESKETAKAIATKVVQLFKQKIQNNLNDKSK